MISVIVPLYNEEDNVVHYPKDLFPIIDAIGAAAGEKIEYVFVDDGSRDATVERIRAVAGSRPDVRILLHEKNQGMGAAIKTGIAGSYGDLIVTLDADLTFRPADVEKLIKKYGETHADLVSGSPYLEPGLLEEVTPFRLFMSRSVNALYRLLLGGGITCVSPVFRLYRREALSDLQITSNNFEINAEIIAKLLIAKKNVVEVPVPLLKRKYGESKINIKKEIKNNILLLTRIFRTKYLGQEWK